MTVALRGKQTSHIHCRAGRHIQALNSHEQVGKESLLVPELQHQRTYGLDERLHELPDETDDAAQLLQNHNQSQAKPSQGLSV